MLFTIVPLAVQGSEPDYLDSLRIALTNPPGVEISFSIQQIQFEERWSDSGIVEIAGRENFFIEFGDQAIKMEGKYVSTWNKSTSQLIRDALPDGETNIFQLLTGQQQGIVVNRQSITNNSIILSASIEQSLSVEIFLTRELYYPQKIVIESDKQSKTVLTVKDIKKLAQNNRFESFNPSVKEVIDLRE